MSIRITQIESRTEDADLSEALTPSSCELTILKVEGTLHLTDAELLEKICRESSQQTGRPVTIKLNDVCFVDSDSAAVLCRMKRENVITVEGLNLFITKVMELADGGNNCLGPKC